MDFNLNPRNLCNSLYFELMITPYKKMFFKNISFQDFDLPKYAVRFTTAVKYQSQGSVGETRTLILDLVERDLSDTDYRVSFQVYNVPFWFEKTAINEIDKFYRIRALNKFVTNMILTIRKNWTLGNTW